MTSGKRITPEMAAYILANQNRYFPAEIAYNLQVLYGRPITKDGVRKWLRRNANKFPYTPAADIFS